MVVVVVVVVVMVVGCAVVDCVDAFVVVVAPSFSRGGLNAVVFLQEK